LWIKDGTVMNTPSDQPEHRIKRGCNFIILLLAILSAINVSAAGINNLASQIFLGLFVFAVIMRLVVATEKSNPE
jgi:Ca2+/Na+ antiporter